VYLLDVTPRCVEDALETSDVSDGADRRSTDLPHVFGDFIRDMERLIRVLIEKLLIVADVRPVHLSVGALVFQIEREYVRQQSVESPANI
jgi:hypothetical protein